MMKNAEDCKPCPFCGAGTGNIYIVPVSGYLDESVGIFCNACKQTVVLEENDQEGFTDICKDRAIRAWNRRDGWKMP